MISELLLNFTTNSGCKSFTIKDVSNYNENLPVTCGQLVITTPGFCNISYFDVPKDFEKTFNLSNLGHQIVDGIHCLTDLPEGNYTIKYSINPNDVLFVEYNYFHTCLTERRYFDAVCQYLEDRCDMTISEKRERREKLDDIYSALKMSKISAEECNDVETADELLAEANDKLDKLNSESDESCG
jgi:hypothetical protein